MTDDAIDRYIERIAREEQAELERGHGEEILRLLKGDAGPRPADALIGLLNQAHTDKAQEDTQQ
jgi:hypothetical protein